MSGPNRTVPGYTHVIGASELGRCIKASVADWSGYEPMPVSDQMQEVFDRGHVHEDECVAAFEARGDRVHDRQMELVIPCTETACVVVHVDGVLRWDDSSSYAPEWGIIQERVLEIKSPSTWHKAEQAFRTDTFTDPYMYRIAWQVSAQMAATGMEAVVACVEDGQVLTFGVEVAPFTPEDIRDRVMTIETLAEEGILPNACEQNDYPCPFAYLHETVRDEADRELDALIDQWAYWDQREKDAKEGKKQAAAQISIHMGDRETYDANRAKVSIYEQAGPSKWDEKLMVADGIDPSRYKKPGSPSVRMKITLREEGASE